MKKMVNIRAFVAFEMSEEMRENLRTLVGNLKRAVNFTPAHPSWVKGENVHLTLKFLGNIEEGAIDGIESVMKKAVAGISPFSIRVQGLGVFPNKRNPRVLWIGIKDGVGKVKQIQQEIDRGLEEMGFERERRPFHAHLTLARIKSLRGTGAMMNILKSHMGANVGSCKIDRLILFRSQLDPKGAIYTKIREVLFNT